MLMLFLLLHPEGNVLEEVARTYRVAERLKKVEKVLDGKSGLDPEKVFRSHLAKWGDRVFQPDIGHRETLDLLLGGLSALHVGGLHATAANQLTEPGVERIEALLDHPAIADWYERHYPFAPPILVRENLHGRLPEDYMEQWIAELCEPAFGEQYRRFLHLDQRFVSNELIGDFLYLLDDFYVEDTHLSDLQHALEKPDKLAKWLRKKAHVRLIEAMQSYFDFAEDLDSFLGGLDRLPIMRGHVWLHFAYWFGSGGKRMREVAGWLQDAAQRTAAEEAVDPAASLAATLQRLGNPGGYPAALIGLAAGPIAPWLEQSGVGRRLERPQGNFHD